MNIKTQLEKLSRRELQVAMKIIDGMPNKRIARDLFISERTVKFHCANIYRKLDISSRNTLMSTYFKEIYAKLRTDRIKR